jgi:hypothetical protein
VTQRDRIVVGVLAVVAVLGGFWFTVIKPKRAEVAALQEQVAQQEQQRDDALAQAAAGEQARRTFAKDYATIAELGKAVPVGDQVPSLVYQLEKTAVSAKIDFRSIKLRSDGAAPAGTVAEAAPTTVESASQAEAAIAPPGSAVGPAGFPTLPFAFTFEGGFFDMERFLSALEKHTSTTGSGERVITRGRLLTVDGFGISAAKVGEGFPRIRASVSATAYVLPPGEDATGGATLNGPGTASGAGTPAGAPAPSQGGGPAPTTAAVGGVTP